MIDDELINKLQEKIENTSISTDMSPKDLIQIAETNGFHDLLPSAYHTEVTKDHGINVIKLEGDYPDLIRDEENIGTPKAIAFGNIWKSVEEQMKDHTYINMNRLGYDPIDRIDKYTIPNDNAKFYVLRNKDGFIGAMGKSGNKSWLYCDYETITDSIEYPYTMQISMSSWPADVNDIDDRIQNACKSAPMYEHVMSWDLGTTMEPSMIDDVTLMIDNKPYTNYTDYLTWHKGEDVEFAMLEAIELAALPTENDLNKMIASGCYGDWEEKDAALKNLQDIAAKREQTIVNTNDIAAAKSENNDYEL